MSTPDPKTVREIARKHILDDRHRAHDIGPAVLGRFGPDGLTKPEYHAYCDAVRETIRTAQITVEWPDEQQPADVVSAEQQQPFVADADTPAGRIGVWLTAWKRYFGTLGLPFGADLIAGPPPSAEPRVSADDFGVVLEVLAVVLAERARSAAAEQQQDGAAGGKDSVRTASLLAFLDLHRERRGHDVIASLAVGDGRTVELTQVQLRAFLAEREADLRVMEMAITMLDAIEWHGDSRGDDVQSIVGSLHAHFADRIEALATTETEES